MYSMVFVLVNSNTVYPHSQNTASTFLALMKGKVMKGLDGSRLQMLIKPLLYIGTGRSMFCV